MKLQIIVFLTVLCGLSHRSFSQQDTLALKSYEDLKQLITTHQTSDTVVAFNAARSYITKAQRQEAAEKEVKGLFALARLYSTHQDMANYFKVVDQAIAIAKKEHEDLLHLQGYYYKASGYYSLGQWDTCVEVYFEALEEAERQGDSFSQNTILTSIAGIKTATENPEEAILFQKEALKRIEKLEVHNDSLRDLKRRLRFSNYRMLGRNYIFLKQPDSSIWYMNRILNQVTTADSLLTKIVLFQKTEAYLDKGIYDRAQQILDSASLYFNPPNGQQQLIKGMYALEIHLGQQEYRLAVDAGLKGIKDYGNIPEDEEAFMGDYYKTLAKAYKGLGKLDSANYYLEKYINTTNEFGKIKSGVENTFKQQEVRAFQEELTYLQGQETSKNRLLLFIVAGGASVIAMLLFLLWHLNKRRKENEQKFEALLAKMNDATSYETVIDTKDEVLDQKASSDVSEEITAQILEGLQRLEEQEFFLRSGCNAVNVAKKIKTNTTYLSKVINAQFSKNFSTYINDLRINYAVVKLKNDARFRGYTVSAIANELGYKSADSFTKYFKQHTGLLPSFYIKKIASAA